MLTHSTGSPTTRSTFVGWQRLGGAVAALFVLATTVLFGPSTGYAAPAAPAAAGCSAQDWQNPQNFDRCLAQLPDVSQQEQQCLTAPTPDRPNSGMPGWFASQPDSSKQPGPKGLYSRYGYGGYSFTQYDNGCVSNNVGDYFSIRAANFEMTLATSIVAASNALREAAWQPQNLWGWANPLVQKATQSVYKQVFTVFGTITLGVIGLYLLWRSRQSDMSSAMTTAGWAILVMVAVTAIAAWPVRSANIADKSLITGLNVVHNAIGPPAANTPLSQCTNPAVGNCQDQRPPAVRAGDTAVETLVFRNWLRGELGSATSPTAQKYGYILYDSKTLSWDEVARTNGDQAAMSALIGIKKQHWEKVAKQIKTEDPEAYSYLQGNRGMDEIGAGLIAILSALFFAMFDITASILVLLGFLIFRWAVIAAPILGTIGLLRPASAGIRRLLNAVVAAIFNIIIFGTGAAIYLFAVDLIMGTVSLPGWLQVVLVWLTGVVGWLLLRPYRRITQLGGKDPVRELAMIGSWNRRFARDLRDTPEHVGDPTVDPMLDSRYNRRGMLVVNSRTTVIRPETRTEDVAAPTAR
ncbi:MAG TPA: MFS transporter, partial [Rugosimonospora sp.]|nr:MFS transporter [Rugosimonospora sp.]